MLAGGNGVRRRDGGWRAAPDLLRAARPRAALRWAALTSFALHAGLLAAFLLLADRAGRGAREAIDATPMVELVMVEQKGQGPTTGQAPPLPERTARTPPAMPSAAAPPVPPPAPAVPRPPEPGAAVASTTPPVPAPPTPSPVPPAPPPSPPAAEAEALPLPPPPLPPPAVSPTPPTAAPPLPRLAAREAPPRPPGVAQAPAPASAAPPAPNADTTLRINLGGTDSLTNALVEGEGGYVIPAGPDPKVHNREPIYPVEAARLGEEGTVLLLIHVSPEGLASGVDIARSSGFTLLDRAARDAVESWRFVPAVRDGQPIPSNMPFRVMFQLN